MKKFIFNEKHKNYIQRKIDKMSDDEKLKYVHDNLAIKNGRIFEIRTRISCICYDDIIKKYKIDSVKMIEVIANYNILAKFQSAPVSIIPCLDSYHVFQVKLILKVYGIKYSHTNVNEFNDFDNEYFFNYLDVPFSVFISNDYTAYIEDNSIVGNFGYEKEFAENIIKHIEKSSGKKMNTDFFLNKNN